MRSKVIKLQDLIVPVNYTLQGIGTSQSMLGTFAFCKMAYLIRLNRLSRKDKIKKTGFGSLFHFLLDRTYTMFMKKGTLPSENTIERWIQKFKKKNVEYELSRDTEQIDLQTTNASILMKHYLRRYADDFIDTKILHIEKVFNILFYCAFCRGKVDGLIKDKHGFYWLLEHKTRMLIYEQEIQSQIKFDFQSLFYITMIEKLLGIIIRGVYYNVIRNPKHARKKKESWYRFEKRMNNEISKNPKHFFKRVPQIYTNYDKKLFRYELRNRLDEINQFLDRPLIYKNENCCVRRFACDHLDACASGRLVNYIQKDTLFPELEED